LILPEAKPRDCCMAMRAAGANFVKAAIVSSDRDGSGVWRRWNEGGWVVIELIELEKKRFESRAREELMLFRTGHQESYLISRTFADNGLTNFGDGLDFRQISV
jgi:hypothetical protein